MDTIFYKKREGRFLSGVLAGFADKFHWDLPLIRVLAAIFIYLTHGFGVFLYLMLAIFLPYKEDIEREKYGTGPRRRKDAKPINDDDSGLFF